MQQLISFLKPGNAVQRKKTQQIPFRSERRRVVDSRVQLRPARRPAANLSDLFLKTLNPQRSRAHPFRNSVKWFFFVALLQRRSDESSGQTTLNQLSPRHPVLPAFDVLQQ